jgi:DNA-binding transcriptional regulator YhcF (GntR family)
MAAKDLAKAVAQRFAGMERRERIAKIRKLAGASPADAKFVRKTFPELYREAFLKSSRGVGARSAASRRRARGAATR